MMKGEFKLPAVYTNASWVTLENGTIRISFGTNYRNGQEPQFYSAVVMRLEVAEELVKCIEKAIDAFKTGAISVAPSGTIN